MKLFLKGLVLLFLVVALSVGCKKKEETVTTTDTASTFNDQGSTKINNSVVSLPKSLQATTAAAARVGKLLASDPQYAQSSGMEGIYSGITNYVSLAEAMKDLVKLLVSNIVKSPLLASANVGQEILIPDDPADPNAPKKVKVEKPATGYDWKVNLYDSAAAVTPYLVIQFSLTTDSAKGIMRWKFSEEDSRLTAAGITGVSVGRSVEVVFDGTATSKGLEVKVVQDLAALRTYAEANWSTLTAAQKTAIDLGQPDKVFLNASFDGTYFTIYGTSYHPGWSLQDKLNGNSNFWGTGRTMYSFKAMSKEGTTSIAKLYLALPTEDLTDTTNMWTNDSVGKLFGQAMTNQFNKYINPFFDATANNASSAGTIEVEKQNGAFMLKYMFGTEMLPGVTALTKFTGSFTQAQYDAAKTFWTGNTGMSSFFGTDLATFQSGFTAATSTSSPSKESYYFAIMSPVTVASVTTAGGITEAQLRDFINNSNTDTNAASLKATYASVTSLVNPAFYNQTSGFLGTLDTSTDTFYKWSGTSLAASTDQSSITDMKAFDLSKINPYVPADVKAAILLVE